MATDADAARKRADADGIEFVFAQFVDMNAKPSAKLVPITNWDSMVSEGAGFAGFAAGPIGQTPASPDMMAVPDLASYTAVPFKPGLARFACDITVEGEEWPYCPRTILRRQLERAKSMGYTFKVGMELEFFLLRESADGGIELADPLDNLDQPCYDMKGLTRQYDFLSTLSRYVNQLGWGSYANDHEDANGQFESNFEFADALTTADRAIFFRYMVHAMAQERGMLATFMPKPFRHLTGNGGHFHMSLWDADGDDATCSPTRTTRNGLGPVAAGLPLHRRAEEARDGLHRGHRADREQLQAADDDRRHADLGGDLVADLHHPRREQPHADAAAPRRARRGPHRGRLVQPVPGDGGDPGRRPGRRSRTRSTRGRTTTRTSTSCSAGELRARGIELLPANLLDATRNLAEDDVIRKALGNTGTEDYVDYYVKTKQEEWNAYHEQVTPWEVQRYLTLF